MKNYVLIFFLLAVFHRLANSMPQKNALFRDRRLYSNSQYNRYLGGTDSASDHAGSGADDHSHQASGDSHGNSHDTHDDHGSHDDSHDTHEDDSHDTHDHDSHDTHDDYSHDDHHDIDHSHGDVDSDHNHHHEEVLDVSQMSSGLSNALGGDPNQPGLNLPEIPVPRSYNDVSDTLNTAVSKFEKLPGINLITSKDGIFGDTFSDDENEPDSNGLSKLEDLEHDHIDYITGGNTGGELPPNVEELLQINLGDEQTLDKSYISISGDLKVYENTYLGCLEALSELDFNQQNIEKCVGKDHRFVDDDIAFFKRKILAKADSIIQARFFENCYKPAGSDLVLSSGCDLLQKDTINLVWSELNYHQLVDYHRNKYMFEHANLPNEFMDEMIVELKYLYAKQDSLLVELYNHSVLTHQRIKDYLADRTLDIEEDIQEYGPLERGKLTTPNVIQVDTVKSKLQKLNEIREANPWVMNKRAGRKTMQVGGGSNFQSPWGKGQEKDYGRAEVINIPHVQRNLIDKIEKHMELR